MKDYLRYPSRALFASPYIDARGPTEQAAGDRLQARFAQAEAARLLMITERKSATVTSIIHARKP